MPFTRCQLRTELATLAGRGLLIGLTALMIPDAVAQNPGAAAPQHSRPRVGLVLAGGGARGGAHVGVLKVLEELRVPIDCIAGTSMGALVGGGYAAGMPASDIERFIRNVDWKAVVGGVGSRPLEPVEQRRFNDASGSLELGLKDGKIVPPPGLIASSRIEDVLRAYVAQARAVPNFDRLPIPYRAVATDMLTGNMVVLDHGDIAAAMRASMAIPGAFAPVVMEPYLLSDGFVVRNLPIDVARNECADIVIAVNLVKPPVTSESLAGPGRLLSRADDIMSEANERIQLQTLTERDVRIDVELGDIGAADFERTPEAIALGEKAARAVAVKLSRLSVSEEEYTVWRRGVTVRQDLEIRLADVEFKGLKRINAEYLRTLTRVRAGDTVDIAAISGDAARLAALDDIEGVNYQLTGDPSHPTLVWEPTEKARGPDYLRPSLGVYFAGSGEVLYALELQHIRRWLNAYGGQWRNWLAVGTTSFLKSSLYQPVDTAQTFFVEPAVFGGRSLEYLYNDYKRIAEYRFYDLGGRLDFGVNLAPSCQIRAGYWTDRRRLDVFTGSPLLPTGQATDAGLAATAFCDSRSSSSFATQGSVVDVEYFKSAESLGAQRDWQRLEAGTGRVFQAGKTTLYLVAAGGTDLGSALPGDRAFSLGGPQSFPGMEPGAVRARRYWTVQADPIWHLADIVPIARQALYGGIGLEAGHAYERVDPVPNGSLYGVAAFIGGPTPVGTLTLGVGKATGSWGIWVTLGAPVGSGSILDQPIFR